MEDLLGWAEARFQEDVPVAGSSKGQAAHLRQVDRHRAKRARKEGQEDAEDPAPPDPLKGLPLAAEDAWWAFMCLHQQRAPAMSEAPTPLSFLEIEAFQRTTGQRLTPWVVDAILRLDALYRKAVTDGRPSRNRHQGKG